MSLADFAVPMVRGLFLGASLIVAIGAQNAFVLRTGLRRRFVFPVALSCTLSDALLITLGAAGFGSVVRSFPLALKVATWAGAIFLLVYGLRAFHSAWKPVSLDPTASDAKGPESLHQALLMCIAFSVLNPHVWLDTVVLLGGIAGQYAGTKRAAFAFGACLASAIWFFALAYGAAWLTPLFRKPITWRVLDVLIGCIMLTIAASLARSAIT